MSTKKTLQPTSETATMPQRLYPYSRCSTGGQDEGDSFRRQGVAAYLEAGEVSWSKQLADKNGWIYDDTYALVDRGKSGYHKKNLTPTAGLTRFLNLVKDGTVCPGSILAVERLDRLTRQEIMGAAQLFMGILAQGVWIATRDNDRVYRAEGADMMTVLEPLWIMYGSWLESNKKSAWSSSAWSRARARQKQGEAIFMGTHPAWVRRAGTSWEVIEEVKQLVLRVHAMAREMGFLAIAQRLNEEHVPLVSGRANTKRWTEDQIRIWLTRRGVLGEDWNGNPAYPPIMTEEQWQETQRAIKGRRGKGGRPGKQQDNLFRGLLRDASSRRSCYLMSKCGRNAGYSYLAVERTRSFACGYGPMEDLLLQTLSMLRVQDVSDSPERADALEQDIATLTGELTELNVQVAELQLQLADRRNARIIPMLAESLGAAEAARQETAERLTTIKFAVQSGRSEALATAQTLAAKYLSATGEAKRSLAAKIRSSLPAVIDTIWVQAQRVNQRQQIVHVQVWLRSGVCRYVRLLPMRGSLRGVEPWDCSPEAIDFRLAGR